MTLPTCPDCNCIPTNIANDKFKQDVESLLCQTLTELGFTFAEGDCNPCNCIGPNIGNDKFKQDVEILLCSLLSAIGGDSPLGEWNLLGNSGTVDGTNFLGTIDNVPLTLRVHNIPTLKLFPAYPAGLPLDSSPSILVGDPANIIDDFSKGWGNGILSGGAPGVFFNEILGDDAHGTQTSVICGGQKNKIINNSYSCNIGGGLNNLIEGEASTSVIGGGLDNTVNLSSAGTIAGGYQNFTNVGFAGTIGGGWLNRILEVGGNSSEGATISGGENGTITSSENSVIAGGTENVILNGSASVVSGGDRNQINGADSSNDFNFIGSGSQNQINQVTASDACCSILGGHLNEITGDASSILGGVYLKLGNRSVGFSAGDSDTVYAGKKDLTAFSNVAYFGDVDLWVGNTGGVAKKLKLFEPNAVLDYSTTNYTSFQAPALAGNIEYVLPNALPSAGNKLTVDTIVGTVVTLKWA